METIRQRGPIGDQAKQITSRGINQNVVQTLSGFGEGLCQFDAILRLALQNRQLASLGLEYQVPLCSQR